MRFLPEHYREFEFKRLAYQVKPADPENASASVNAPKEVSADTAKEAPKDERAAAKMDVEHTEKIATADVTKAKGTLEQMQKGVPVAPKMTTNPNLTAKVPENPAIERRNHPKGVPESGNKPKSAETAAEKLENTQRERLAKLVQLLNQKYFNVETEIGRKRSAYEKVPLMGKIANRKEGSKAEVPILGELFGDPAALEGADYEDVSEAFGKRMKEVAEAKLDYLKATGNLDQAHLEALQSEIQSLYEGMAKADKNKEHISSQELLRLAELAHPKDLDILRTLVKSPSDQDRARLEAFYLLNKDSWMDGMERVGENFTEQMAYNGKQEKFKDAVNTRLKEMNRKPVSDFNDATDTFMKLVELHAKAGLNSTMEFFGKFEAEMNTDSMKAFADIEPPSFRGMVYDNYDRLLNGRLNAETPTDKAIVEFMRSDREDRESLLKDSARRANLLTAIQTAKKYYVNELTDEQGGKYAGLIQRLKDTEGAKPTTRRSDLEAPTRYDEAARLQALVILNGEAEHILNNYDPKFGKELTDAKPGEKPALGLDFIDTHKTTVVPYRSLLSRSGFNARDLGVSLLKFMGVAVAGVNILNSMRVGMREGTWDQKIEKSLEYIAKNPMVYAGVGATLGARTLQLEPEYFDYIKSSPAQREAIDNRRKIHSLERQFGPENVKAFVGNEKEWQVMSQLTEEGYETLFETAKESRSQMNEEPEKYQGLIKELITVENLDKVLPNTPDKPALLRSLPQTPQAARMRYLFFKKFFSGKKPNTTDLRKSLNIS